MGELKVAKVIPAEQTAENLQPRSIVESDAKERERAFSPRISCRIVNIVRSLLPGSCRMRRILIIPYLRPTRRCNVDFSHSLEFRTFYFEEVIFLKRYLLLTSHTIFFSSFLRNPIYARELYWIYLFYFTL